MTEDLPEPKVPIRNLGEILDREIPIRVRDEFKIMIGEYSKKIKSYSWKIIVGIWGTVITIVTVWYRR